jgi:UDP-sugar pyrophosphorylase
LQALTLRGSLVIRAVPGARVHIKRLRVHNAGWSFQPLDPSNASEPEALAIRGYRLVKHQTRELNFDRPGVYIVDDGPLVPASGAAGAVAFLAAAIAGALYLLRRS